MKKTIGCLLSIFLVLAMLSALIGCYGTEPERADVYIDGSYKIVYAAEDAAAKKAAEKIALTVKDCGGDTLTVVADTEAAEGKEVLVGAVRGREYSDYTSRMAKQEGWYAGVLNGNIYIQTKTGSYDTVLSAFEQYFVRQEFSETTQIFSSGDYQVDSVMLNGVPLGFYDIVYPISNTRAQMKSYELRERLLEESGYELGVNELAASDGEYCLYIGVLNADGAVAAELDSEEYEAEFGDKYAGICSDREILSQSVDSFVARYFLTGERNVVVRESGNKYLKCWEYLNTHLQKQSDSETTQVVPGVSYERFTMTDGNGSIVTAYVLIAEAGAGWELKVGTHPDYQKGAPVVSTVLNTAQLMQNDGEDVLFACNGGFFRMNDHNYPEGVLIKDGVSMTHVNGGMGEEGCNFFGITKDGRYVAGDYPKLQTVYNDLWQAVGGRGWLLDGGELNDICFGDGDQLGESRHPRTAVGWRENGDLIFAVVDGRQEGYSDGVNLCDMALLMKSYGAVGAQNLDGGGSSTFVTKNADGTLSVKNKPCNENNSLRAVGDCLVLVRAK